MFDLIPRKPLGEMSSFRKEMENLWNRFYDEPIFSSAVTREWLPSTDISETEDKLLITAELPGVDAKDINISISGNLLTIKGEKKQEEEKKDEHCYCSERYYGSFQRSIRLPVNIRTDEVDATFTKGTLHITLQKTEEAKKKEIEIKVK